MAARQTLIAFGLWLVFCAGTLGAHWIYAHNQPPLIVKVTIVEQAVYGEDVGQFMAGNRAAPTILGPGYLSGANPGVLERVAHKRMFYGWSLPQLDLSRFDVLVATRE